MLIVTKVRRGSQKYIFGRSNKIVTLSNFNVKAGDIPVQNIVWGVPGVNDKQYKELPQNDRKEKRTKNCRAFL